MSHSSTLFCICVFFFFKQKTAYELRISDWSSDVCSSDLSVGDFGHGSGFAIAPDRIVTNAHVVELAARDPEHVVIGIVPSAGDKTFRGRVVAYDPARDLAEIAFDGAALPPVTLYNGPRSEEHTSELQSLMRNSYAGF